MTVAQGIDAAGDVAGYFHNGTGTHGFLYSNGSYTILDAPGVMAGTTTVAAMEAGGKIAGYYDNGSTNWASFTTPASTPHSTTRGQRHLCPGNQ